MYKVEVIKDESDNQLLWLRATHNGYSWSSIQIRSVSEIQKIIDALQKVQPSHVRSGEGAGGTGIIGYQYCTNCSAPIYDDGSNSDELCPNALSPAPPVSHPLSHARTNFARFQPLASTPVPPKRSAGRKAEIKKH